MTRSRGIECGTFDYDGERKVNHPIYRKPIFHAMQSTKEAKKVYECTLRSKEGEKRRNSEVQL
jgi:hypothetical protein